MKVETKVGLLAALSLVLVFVFASMMGLFSFLSKTHELHVMYNYAGGLEEGSPVRVMGIKVGKVKKISFTPDYKSPQGEEVKLKVSIVIDEKAWSSLRKDSKFFINLAGVIGEKFLEISSGSLDKSEFQSGDFVRGEDPPRIDQLISQGYGLAGRIIEIVNKNEGSVTSMINQLDRLISNFNKTLALLDRTTQNKDVARLMDNVLKISDDMAYLTNGMRSKKAEDSYQLLHKLLFRLEPVDGPALKKFFQEEGIKAKIL